jgi:serine protease AprX
MKLHRHRLLKILVIVGVILGASAPFSVYSQVRPGQMYIVILKDQPQVSAAQEVQAEYKAQLRSMEDELHQLANQAANLRKPGSAPEGGEVIGQPLPPELQARQASLVSDLRNLRFKIRRTLITRSEPSRESSQIEVIRQVKAYGGEVIYRYESLNALAARLSPQAFWVVQGLPQVERVIEDQLMQSELNVSTHAIGVDTFWPTYIGGGVNVAVIDSGIDHTHPALSGQSYTGQRCLDTAQYFNPDIATLDPSEDDVNGHGTHVAGIVASTDSTYRGVAYGLNALLNGKAGFSTNGIDNSTAAMYWSDEMECVDWALLHNAYGADVINLSYGSSTIYDDGSHERFWDGVVSQMGVLVAISAGNAGGPSYKVYSPSIAYNVISVANVNDGNTISRGDDIIYSGSSRGPTAGGRKKPDLAAPGTSIMSTDKSWEGAYADFISFTGTSMAAPHVAGAAALVMSRGVTDPKAVKALLINTAEDKGVPGWDDAYGWGYIDLTQLSAHIDDYFLDAVAANPAYRLYAGPADTGEAATLVWNRRAVYNGSSYPITTYTLTNLDLYAYDEASGDVITNSLSLIDNVEQVRFSSAYTETVIKVDTVSASIAGVGAEPFALATGTGYTSRNGPSLALYPSGTGDLQGQAGSQVSVSLRVGNEGDLKAQGISIDLIYSSGLELNSGPSLPASLASLDVGELSSPYTWTLVKTDDNPQTLRFNVSSLSYGEVFTATLGYSSSLWLPLVTK